MMHARKHHASHAHHANHANHGQKKESTPVVWATVIGWTKKNPHRQAPPPSAESVIATHAQAETHAVSPAEDATVWRQISVAPSTPLSCVLYALNHNSYSENSEIGRKEQLRTACTELQGRIDAELKGRAWPKAKTNEGIVEVAEKEVSPWSAVGLAALAELYKIQMVILNETEKKIHYIPEDICAWDHERPIYFYAHNYRSIYQPPAGFSSKSMLAWLEKQEADGWTFTAKEVKGTIEELQGIASQAKLILPPGKLKKDTLVAHISRGLAIAHIAAWARLPE